MDKSKLTKIIGVTLLAIGGISFSLIENFSINISMFGDNKEVATPTPDPPAIESSVIIKDDPSIEVENISYTASPHPELSEAPINLVVEGSTIEGNLDYKGHEVEYSYVAPTSGNYRFNFDINDVNHCYRFFICDDRNELLTSHFARRNGVTVNLKSGNTYKIRIMQYIGFPIYSIHIGVPKETEDISGNSFAGIITYTDQENYYTFSPTSSGNHRFNFDINDVNHCYRFFIYDDRNELLTSHFARNNGVTVALESGRAYKIKIAQYTGFPTYSVYIGIPNKAKDISSNFFAGQITYTDQQDHYTFSPTSSGNHKFNFDINDVNHCYRFFIYDDRNELLTSHFARNNGVTVELESDKTYRIMIMQYTDFPSYSVTISLQ